MTPLALMTHPQIDPVALALGPISIHWYGLMYLLAFLSFMLLAKHRAKQNHHPIEVSWVDDMVFYGAMGVLLGGRVGYMLFYQLDSLISNPISLIYINEGGMSFHGGLLGVTLAMYLLSRKHQLSFFQVTDFIAPMVPLGLMFGRIGNFINGELYGRVTSADFPLAMIFPHTDQLPRHPSQLYQAVLEGLLLFIVLWLFSKKPRPTMQVSGLFLVGYGAARFAVEFVRTPDAHLNFVMFDWMTRGQQLSIPMILLGLFLFVLGAKRANNATAK